MVHYKHSFRFVIIQKKTHTHTRTLTIVRIAYSELSMECSNEVKCFTQAFLH